MPGISSSASQAFQMWISEVILAFLTGSYVYRFWYRVIKYKVVLDSERNAVTSFAFLTDLINWFM